MHARTRQILTEATLLSLLGVCLLADRGLGAAGSKLDTAEDWAEAQHFWAFQTPKPQALPRVVDERWPRHRLDYFILAQLERAGLAPSSEAGKARLIRRVTYALTGLPPTPEELESFLSDDRPVAYEVVVDRLLGSPRFGERLTSLWLNVARYAEDQAHQVGDDTKHFYPNAYHYRAWVIDAFNRDLPYDQFVRLQLAADRLETAAPSDLAALGFLGLGPKYYNRGRIEVMADEWEDRVDTVSRSFLGLTVACARCHDHKYDPITMEDYYALAGVFASTKLVNKTRDGSTPDDEEKEEKDKKKKEVDPGIFHMVEEGDVKDLNLFLRGNAKAPGEIVPRRFLRVLCDGAPEPFTGGSGRRELAEAIVDPANPLTGRVFVNRIWTMVFGRGLVATPSNFGSLGGRPSHPELLDDLAVRFVQGGWSIKTLIREMVLSSTYRQNSMDDPARSALDEANALWWRMDRRRLTVEQWRDSILFVADNVDWAGGKSMELNDPENLRRTVYGRVSRLELNSMLTLFDYPDANVHSPGRPTTTTATQKLFVLNSPFMLRQARVLAERLTASAGESDEERVEHAMRLLYGRPAEEEERTLALAFLRRDTESSMSRWEQFAQVLLASNEMMYVD